MFGKFSKQRLYYSPNARARTRAAVLPFEQYFRLEYRHEAGHLHLLHIARETLRILVDRNCRRQLVALDAENCAPFGENRSLFFIQSQPLGKIEKTLGDEFGWTRLKRRRAEIDS